MPRPRTHTANTGSDSESSTPLRAPSALKGKGRESNNGPLQRGSACLNCRKRKLKCDAGKPACQKCLSAGAESDCSYDNGKALSKTQLLQARIQQLEAKLLSLQGKGASGATSPHSSSSSVTGAAGPDSSSNNNSHSLLPSATSSSDLLRPLSSHGNSSSSLDPFAPTLSAGLGADLRPSSSHSPANNSAYPLSLFPDSLGGTDFTSGTISPNLLSGLGGSTNRVSPFLQPDVYDPNAPWPNASTSQNGSMGASFGGVLGPHDLLASTSNTLYSSPSGSSFMLDDASNIATGAGSSNNNGSNSLGAGNVANNINLGGSTLDFRGSTRGATDPNCITATPEGRRYLLQLFLPHRQRYYFDVHVGRFMEAVSHPDPRKRPHPCLMDAIYLIACYISRNEELRQHEVALLSKARQGLCDSLEHSDRLWNFVQASSLIAFYLYQNGRFIEAYHQTCQVARFAVSCGLHQISSPFWPDATRENTRTQAPWTVTNMSVRRAGSMLEPPKDQIEVGERILAFWHIFLLDRCGSIMTNLPAALPDECDSFSQIETVWPRTLDEYERSDIYESDYGTVRFLYQPDTPTAAGRADTIFTLQLKASALFERASRLGSRYSPTMSEQQMVLFHSVDFAISRFSATLPYARNTGTMGEIPPTEPNAPVNARLVFVHTLALTAQMRLHYLAAKDEPVSYSKRLNAANSVVAVANELMGSNVDYSEFDMLLGYCWKTACDVFIWERRTLTQESGMAALDHKIDTLISHMQTLRTVFPLTLYQIEEVMASRAGSQLPMLTI